MTSPFPSACACLLEKKPIGTRHAAIDPKELLRRGERLGARLRGGRTILGGQEWGQAFRSSGPVSGHDRLKSCTSLPDLIGRHLLVEYCGREELAHVALSQSEAERQI
jgi:hypothetical protein